MEDNNITSFLKLHFSVFRFLIRVEDGYRDNPYHNRRVTGKAEKMSMGR